jgi:hypothetical protein
MHTTLNILKNTDACKPGYGRMISFFGDSKTLGDQVIPMHVVALVGGADDANWTAINSMVIDKEKYEEFYRRHLPSVLKYMLQYKCGSSFLRNKHKNPIIEELKQESLRMQTYEECQAWLDRASMYNFSHEIFSSLLRSRVWTSPATFIVFCFDHVNDTFSNSSSNQFGQSLYEKLEAPAPIGGRLSSRNNDDDEDEGYDEDEDDEPPRRGRARPAVAKKNQHYWFKTSADGRTKGQQIAHLFTDTPYDFIKELEFKTPRGMKVVKGEGKVELQMAVTEEQKIFSLLRAATTKAGDMVDADQES